jgi:hypothetical protein
MSLANKQNRSYFVETEKARCRVVHPTIHGIFSLGPSWTPLPRGPKACACLSLVVVGLHDRILWIQIAYPQQNNS